MPSKWPETLVHRIDEMIAEYPGETAIRDNNGTTWTYQQLDEQVVRITSALLKANTKPGSAVGVFQEASPHLVFSLLAVLRAGAIYIPLDWTIPPARLSVMIEESKCSVLLANSTTAAQAEALKLSISVTVLDVLRLQEEKEIRCPPSA